ncbi:MAG: tail fiber protein [Methylobacter sp.]|nr:MAG: tail fiber protein [Methylobacter sp.]
MVIEALSNIEKSGTGAFAAPGEIKQQCGSTIQAGWMLCEGQLLAVADYPLLFAVLGSSYGGNGTTNFALPNYRHHGAGARRIICVDYHAPQPVLGLTVPAAIHGPAPGYYKAGAVLSFSVQLLEDIAITGGPISLSIDIGGVAHSLAFISGSAREWLFADYTVQSGDNGEVTATINLNGATLSSSGIAAVLSVGNTTGLTVDTTAPTITFSALTFSNDTGTSTTDFITATAAQTITATLSAAPSSTERVFGSLDNGSAWMDITNRLAGTALIWDQVTLTGSNTLKLKITDLAGNDGTVASQAYVLDTTAPATPTISLATDSGASNSDGITNVGTINVGALESGATWQYSTNTGSTWTNGIGNSFTLAAGAYAIGSVQVKQTDVAGNISAVGSNATAITVDTTAPVVPTVAAQTTANTTPTITGTATVDAGDVLTVAVNGITYTAGAGDLSLVGTAWTLVIPAGNALTIGTYNVTATVTDTAGNATGDATSGELVITA